MFVHPVAPMGVDLFWADRRHPRLRGLVVALLAEMGRERSGRASDPHGVLTIGRTRIFESAAWRRLVWGVVSFHGNILRPKRCSARVFICR